MSNKVFESDPNTPKLLSALHSSKLVAFIGSGLSTATPGSPPGCGYPSWTTLVSLLCTRCLGKAPPDCTAKCKPSRLLALAERAKRANEAAYVDVLSEMFGQRVDYRKSAFGLLLRTPFSSYVTTNFDPMLAIAHSESALTSWKLHAFPDIHPGHLSTGGVFYIHGYVAEGQRADPLRIMLTKSDFDLYESSGLHNFWHTLLLHNHVLFMGCMLGEPEFDMIFPYCMKILDTRANRFGAPPPMRFALMPRWKTTSGSPSEHSPEQREMNDDTVLMKRLSDYRITTIFYDPKDDDYSGLLDVFRHLPTRTPVLRYSAEELTI
jgi:hypothetical protein